MHHIHSKKTNRRAAFLQWLAGVITPVYLRWSRRGAPAWGLNVDDLMAYPEGSLGWGIAELLGGQGYELMPAAERHDAFHLLTGYGMDAEGEVLMQFWLLGNGKRSPYTLAACLGGCLLLPEYWGRFIATYRAGRGKASIVDWDFKALLKTPLHILKMRMGKLAQTEFKLAA